MSSVQAQQLVPFMCTCGTVVKVENLIDHISSC